jgi:hypothetical protein
MPRTRAPLVRPTTAGARGTHSVQCGAYGAPGRTGRAPAQSLTGGETPMEPRVPRPDTIQALRWGADAAFAMLAGLQLDVFTPLQGGPLTPAQLAEAIGVGPARLRLLLYALVAAGLLTEQDGRFANTPEAQHFLVQGPPTSLLTRGGLLKSSAVTSLLTAYCGVCKDPQPKGGKSCFARPVSTNGGQPSCSIWRI